jgi:hypothetical protein
MMTPQELLTLIESDPQALSLARSGAATVFDPEMIERKILPERDRVPYLLDDKK